MAVEAFYDSIFPLLVEVMERIPCSGVEELLLCLCGAAGQVLIFKYANLFRPCSQPVRHAGNCPPPPPNGLTTKPLSKAAGLAESCSQTS